MFHLTNVLLNLLSTENYAEELKMRIEKLKEIIQRGSQNSREFLKCLNKKPIATKLFEPRIQTK